MALRGRCRSFVPIVSQFSSDGCVSVGLYNLHSAYNVSSALPAPLCQPRSDVRGLALGLALCVAHGLVCAEEDEHGVVAVWAAVRECAHSIARDSVTCRFFEACSGGIRTRNIEI